ncbi:MULTISPECIES: LysE/ArgO family amino acid transporter [Acinetobacter]|jgi:L-lysine exporter family protein LysE/ArgO|uniref:LysE/ArgO family amino acid transporter n=1 Tax=Acinetobacter TaxID=469 RepID=UPI000775FC52|nr:MULTISPECIES: LysE/ArgO family amino acid transporter [Acinetobacter]KXO78174.1 amino acid transporter [Acinetobacter venetianus]MBC67444.1 amino acid transporter [Acinetobacter sp.]MBT51092.1 amino acid transporter [Acinetobacter sp.]HIQ34430.1 amino acid transporter [Acinetobacter venetianus]HJP48299.1 LysE/ArgO family amino acid transporter [Acinetobacter venetianus]|tara:strand:+ start:353 stop:949 length:597 start_codon:yes stop_codon:yes gene_type:complete
MSAFVYGLGIGFSLILAIGAQNAFVLKQGLKQQYVFWVCFICALSDSILIYFGVTGFSKVIANFPLLLTVSKYFGAAFLFLYGLRNFYSAIKNSSSLNPSDIEKDSLLKIIGICLAFTWLNPHVYLDAIILIGSISVQFSDQLYQFAAGTILASWIFFFSVGYGAKMLLPLFKRATSWKILDVLIGITMWTIATMLII